MNRIKKDHDQKDRRQFRGRSTWWRWLLATVLLSGLVYTSGTSTLLSLFKGIEHVWAITATVLVYCMYFIGSFNVWILLRYLTPIPLSQFVRVYMFSWAVGLLVPGQLGDASQILFLKRQGVQMARSGAAYAIDKGLSLIFFIFIAAVGATHYLISISNLLWALIPAGILGIVIFTAAVRLWKKPKSGIFARLHDGLTSFLDHCWSYRERWHILLLNILITIFRWVLQTFGFWAAFRAFNVPVDFFAAATIPVISTLIGYIPVSVAGIGTVELSAVLLFKMEGIGGAEVVAAYLMLRLVLYALAGACLIFLKWDAKPSEIAKFKLEKNKAEAGGKIE